MTLPLLVPADVLSAGQIGYELSLAVPAVVQLADAACVRPVLTIGRIPYYAAHDLPRLVRQLDDDNRRLKIAQQN